MTYEQVKTWQGKVNFFGKDVARLIGSYFSEKDPWNGFNTIDDIEWMVDHWQMSNLLRNDNKSFYEHIFNGRGKIKHFIFIRC
jgi:hypothetical protein